jgi:hypothetical protein
MTEQPTADFQAWKVDAIAQDAVGRTSGDKGIIFTPEELVKAREDKEYFKELVLAKLDQYPQVIFPLLRYPLISLAEDQVKKYVRASASTEPSRIIYSINLIKGHFTAEEFTELLQEACSESEGLTSAFYVLPKEPILSEFLFDSSNKALLKEALKNNYFKDRYRDNFDYIREAVAEGKIDQALIVEAVNEYLQKPDTQLKAINLIANVISAMTGTYREQFIETTRAFYADEPTEAKMYDIYLAKIILPQEVFKDLVLQYLEIFPEVLADQWDQILESLGESAVADMIRKDVENGQIVELFKRYGLAEKIFESGFIPTDLKEKIWKELVNIQPMSALSLVTLVASASFVTEQDVVQIIEAVPLDQIMANKYILLKHSGLTLDELMAKLLNSFEKSDKLNFLGSLHMSTQEIDLASHISPETYLEKISRLAKQDPYRLLLSPGALDEFSSDMKVLREKYPEKVSYLDEHIKQLFTDLVDIDPVMWIKNLHEFMDMFSSDEVASYLQPHFDDYFIARQLFAEVAVWGNILGKDQTLALLKKSQHIHAVSVMSQLKDWLAFIPPTERDAFVEELAEANPGYAVGLSYENRRFRAVVTDSPTTWLVQKIENNPVLASLSQKVMNDLQEKGEESLLFFQNLHNLSGTSEKLAFIAAHDQSDTLLKLLNEESREKAKKESLELLHSYLLLGGEKKVESKKQLAYEVLNQVGVKLGLETLNEGQIAAFLGTMDTPGPMAMYVVQYGESETHRELLKAYFLSIGNQQHEQWKYRRLSLDDFKEHGVLPTNLTEEQYGVWIKDKEATSEESLAPSAEIVAEKIGQTILQNAEHFFLQDFLQAAGVAENELHHEKYVELANLIAGQQQVLGREIGKIGNAVKEAKNNGNADELSELEAQRKQFSAQLSLLRVISKTLRLTQLTAQEVSQGYLFEGDKKADSIVQTMISLQKELRAAIEQGVVPQDEVTFSILTNIGGFLEQLDDEGLKSKQKLLMNDTSSPKIQLEIGSNPLETCQNYYFGMFNECLMGYTEPNTKILTLTNEQGNIIARSIMRLMTDDQGEPAIHVEFVYTTMASPVTGTLLYQHACQKAETMGAKLYVSRKAQNQQGINTAAEVGGTFMAIKSDATLHIRGMEAPAVYVDSAGGKNEGAYEIKELFEVRSSTQILRERIEQQFAGASK